MKKSSDFFFLLAHSSIKSSWKQKYITNRLSRKAKDVKEKQAQYVVLDSEGIFQGVG